MIVAEFEYQILFELILLIFETDFAPHPAKERAAIVFSVSGNKRSSQLFFAFPISALRERVDRTIWQMGWDDHCYNGMIIIANEIISLCFPHIHIPCHGTGIHRDGDVCTPRISNDSVPDINTHKGTNTQHRCK